MVNLELTLYLIGLFVILLGLLIVLRKGPIEIPEGFENELPTTSVVSMDDVKNPLVGMIKKLGKMTAYFANPDIWTDVYKHSQMSITDLARTHISRTKKEEDKKK